MSFKIQPIKDSDNNNNNSDNNNNNNSNNKVDDIKSVMRITTGIYNNQTIKFNNETIEERKNRIKSKRYYYHYCY